MIFSARFRQGPRHRATRKLSPFMSCSSLIYSKRNNTLNMMSLRRASQFLVATGSKQQTRPLTISLFRADREKAGYDRATSDDFAEENDFRFFAKETKNPTSQYRSDLLDEMKKAGGEPGELPGSGKTDNQKKTNQENQS